MTHWLLPAGYLTALVLGVLLGVWSGRRHAHQRHTMEQAAEAAAKETSRRISGLIRTYPDLADAFDAAVVAVGQELGCDLAYVQLVRREEHRATVWRPDQALAGSGRRGARRPSCPCPTRSSGCSAPRAPSSSRTREPIPG